MHIVQKRLSVKSMGRKYPIWILKAVGTMINVQEEMGSLSYTGQNLGQ